MSLSNLNIQSSTPPPQPLHITTDLGTDDWLNSLFIREIAIAIFVLSIIWVWGSSDIYSTTIKRALLEVAYKAKLVWVASWLASKIRFFLHKVFHIQQNQPKLKSKTQESHNYFFGIILAIALAAAGLLLPAQISDREKVRAELLDEVNSKEVCDWANSNYRLVYNFEEPECHALIGKGKSQMSLLEFAKYRERTAPTTKSNNLDYSKYIPIQGENGSSEKLVGNSKFYRFGDITILSHRGDNQISITYSLYWWSDSGYELVKNPS